MEQKQREKVEKEEEKSRRKAEREEKRKEKQRLKEEKEKNKERKKELIAEKKAKAKEAKEMAAKKKKKTTFKPPFAHPLPDGNASFQSLHTSPSEFCVHCGRAEDFNEDWVACDNCKQWWHVHCTDTPNLSAQDFNAISWSCVSCRL